jgi:hypothetical protein
MEQEKKSCKNCKYYLEHYVKLEDRFLTLNDGHCINQKIFSTRKRNKYALKKDCEQWESNASRKQETKRAILKRLERICDVISQMAQILKYDDTPEG